MSDIISLSNPVFNSYAFYTGVLSLKMLAMPLLTGRQRFRKLVFCSPEDTVKLKNAKVKYDDADVERVRRAHLNDLENIFPYIITSWIFLLTDPPPNLAVNLFRVFTASRILHTIVYAVVVVPQPARAISWATGYGITIYMAVHSLCYFMKSF